MEKKKACFVVSCLVLACFLSVALVQGNVGRKVEYMIGSLVTSPHDSSILTVGKNKNENTNTNPTFRSLNQETRMFIKPPTNASVLYMSPDIVNITSEQVNPFKSYSSEPAPMGIADYGINPNTNKFYSYTTTSFLGVIDINSLSTSGGTYSGWMSFQLNVVLKFMAGSSTYVYWLQDVAQLDTQYYNQISFLDNVWNMSSTSSSMSSSGISGSGSIGTSGSTTFYYDQCPSDYWQSYPNTNALKITSTEVNWHPTVTFAYESAVNDTGDTGWITYDTVTFTPITGPIQDCNIIVDGSQYTPSNNFYDAELVACGLGGGATTTDTSSSVGLGLDYYNGNNFQSILYCYNFGSDTAETISNVVDSLYIYPYSGALSMQLGQGGSNYVGPFYGQPAIVEFSITNANGGILYIGKGAPYSACSFVGQTAEVTVGSGNYTVSIGNWENSYVFSAGNNPIITLPYYPGATSSLSTSCVSERVTLSWSAPSNNGGSAITSYRICRGTISGGEDYLNTTSLTMYTDSRTTPGITYYYTVAAVNDVGEGSQSSESIVSVPAIPPTASSFLSVQCINKTNYLSWSIPSNNGGSSIIDYNVYRGISAGGETYFCTLYSTSIIDNDTTPGVTYYYVVTAVNGAGEGPRSSEMSVSVPLLSVNSLGFDVWEVLGIIALIAVAFLACAIVVMLKKYGQKPPKVIATGTRELDEEPLVLPVRESTQSAETVTSQDDNKPSSINGSQDRQAKTYKASSFTAPLIVAPPKTQYCAKCGNKLPENATVCDICWEKVQDSENQALSSAELDFDKPDSVETNVGEEPSHLLPQQEPASLSFTSEQIYQHVTKLEAFLRSNKGSEEPFKLAQDLGFTDSQIFYDFINVLNREDLMRFEAGKIVVARNMDSGSLVDLLQKFGNYLKNVSLE